jgi:hypothetical protein
MIRIVINNKVYQEIKGARLQDCDGCAFFTTDMVCWYRKLPPGNRCSPCASDTSYKDVTCIEMLVNTIGG